VGEHVIDGDQDFMRDCHGRAFVPTSVKLVAQIGSLDRGCCMGRFHQSGLLRHALWDNSRGITESAIFLFPQQ